MALAHSPRIVTDDLFFAYDMSNTQKSWKGEPTVNYMPNPYAAHNGSSIVLGYNYPNNGATYTYRTNVDNPINSPGVLEYYTGNTDYKYFSIDTSTVPTTGTYTFSYYARIVGGATSSNFSNSQLWRANGSDRAVTGDWNPTITTSWRRYSTSGPIEAGTILQYFPMHSGALTGGITVQYCGFQCELKSQSTPFVAGTRSSTQSIVDLTNRNTVTVNSLTYNADGTFSFLNNSGLSLPSINFANAQTIEIWLQPLENDANRRNPYNQAFGGYGTWTHEPDGTINYYYGDAGSDTNPYIGHNSSFTVVQNEIACVCTTRNLSRSWWYKNGIAYTYYDHSFGSLTTDNNNILIGNGYAGTYYGKIYSVKLYNRDLTASEVAQNFNALRRRYGL